jgi:hypothetical protein
MLQQQTASAPI